MRTILEMFRALVRISGPRQLAINIGIWVCEQCRRQGSIVAGSTPAARCQRTFGVRSLDVESIRRQFTLQQFNIQALASINLLQVTVVELLDTVSAFPVPRRRKKHTALRVFAIALQLLIWRPSIELGGLP